MLKRKITDKLVDWKNRKHKPLIIEGVRQCGKSYAVKRFAEDNYDNVYYLDFFSDESLKDIFKGSIKPDDILLKLSAKFPNVSFVSNKTILILDEIQECPEARTSLKFFKDEERIDVIATGSLLGVSGYSDEDDEKTGKRVDKTPKSIPVGAEEIVKMHPLDFEEFLWANNISEEIINEVKKSFDKKISVNKVIHDCMNELLTLYMVVGGMPEVVSLFLETKQLNQVLNLQRNILEEYRGDMVKYAPKYDKARIRQTFNSIPKQLSKEYKKFQYSKVKHGGRAYEYEGSIQWIEDAGIISRSYNLDNLELPLEGNKNDEDFKVFVNDPGLLTAMFEDGTQFSILNGDIYTYKGALYENLVASFFSKMDKKLYYYHNDSLECDFVIRYDNKVTLVETKANKGLTLSARKILDNKNKYHIDTVIKLGNYNVGRSDNILTLPTYMGFLLKDKTLLINDNFPSVSVK